MSRTFPIWAAILIFGMIALFLVGWLNVYIPKDQKEKAKRIGIGKIRDGETATIKCKNRSTGAWCILLPTAVAVAASVMFFIEDFSVLAHAIHDGAIGYITATLIFFFQFILAGALLLMVLYFGEVMSEQDLRSYYKSRYGVNVERDEA